jgi:hypothetical protein
MEKPPNQNCRRNQHQAEYLISLVSFPLLFATRGGVELCEIRLDTRVNQFANLPRRKSP